MTSLTDNNDNSNFKIFSWNARSLYSKLSEFKFKLDKDKPHVCISET